MAKGKNRPPVNQSRAVRRTDMGSLIAAAKDKRESPSIYANHAQFSSNVNEIYIDFYRVEPSPEDAGKPIATLIERVIIPIGLAKGFATGLANMVAGIEKALEIVIPNNRSADPDDIITIWNNP